MMGKKGGGWKAKIEHATQVLHLLRLCGSISAVLKKLRITNYELQKTVISRIVSFAFNS